MLYIDDCRHPHHWGMGAPTYEGDRFDTLYRVSASYASDDVESSHVQPKLFPAGLDIFAQRGNRWRVPASGQGPLQARHGRGMRAHAGGKCRLSQAGFMACLEQGIWSICPFEMVSSGLR
jgi:hypothetical protein